MRHYCTCMDEHYLSKVLAMHGSMEEHCLSYQLWVLALTDEMFSIIDRLDLPNVKLVPKSVVESPSLLAVRGERKWNEYAWTCKSSWILWVLQQVDSVVYIDSDGFFFTSPEDTLFSSIESDGVLLAITPHRFSPSYERYSVNGKFNAGFIYTKNCGNGVACIREWAEQCIEWCFLTHSNGRYGDQKYLDTWVDKWGARAIEHRGVNLAPWNQGKQYRYSIRGEQIYVDNDPLIWYHFHQGLKPAYPLDGFIVQHVYGPYREALHE